MPDMRTIASALFANDVRLFVRHLKNQSPKGFFATTDRDCDFSASKIGESGDNQSGAANFRNQPENAVKALEEKNVKCVYCKGRVESVG